MARARRDARPGSETPAATAGGRVAVLLKWVGGISAVLSLAFALVQATHLISGRVERERRTGELLAVGRRQLDASDYAAAWASARAAADVDARSANVRRLQEDVAMAWLRGASFSSAGAGPHTFAELVDPLVPTLDRGVEDASGARRADLLAHRGWAEFLRGRDGGAQEHDPARFYREALAADPRDPFAHAMWGHWLLWSHGPRGEALAHFASAADAGRERPFVRTLELTALRNDRSPGSEAELLRVVDAVRREGGTVGADMRRAIHGIYWFGLRDPAGRAALLSALPPDDHLATYRWLFAAELRDSTPERSYRLHLAQLEAHAGHAAEARALFRQLGATRDWAPSERAVIDSALAGGGR